MSEGPSPRGGDPSLLLGLSVAAFATLLATSPLDFVGPFRGYWAKMFLLKPNHSIGFILIPLVVDRLVRRSAIGVTGLVLGILSLAFVVHWAFVCFSLVLYLGLSLLLNRASFRSELGRIAAAVAISGLFVLPGIYFIAKYFPHALTLAAGSYPESPMRSDWGDTIPVGASLFFLVTLDLGFVFYLSVVGFVCWLRERTRATLMWASLWLGAYALWGVNYLLYVSSRAREADEFYFFLIFVQAIAAGYGAYRMGSAVGSRLFGSEATRRTALAACILLAAPLGFPFWWHPMAMDSHYRAALEPVWPPVVETTEWIRRETGGQDVFLAASDMMQWIPTLSGRRALPYSESLREPVLQLLRGTNRAAIPADYIVWSEELESRLGETQSIIAGASAIQLVHDAHAIRVYRILRGDKD